jgi:cytochrome c oxidase subunit 1
MMEPREVEAVRREPAPEFPRETFYNSETGLWSWLSTRDHKRIGILFFIGTSISLLIGGTYALLIRIELLTPNHTIVDASAYNRFFTLHGIIMVWLFMIPSIPTTFGNFLLPIMIGARDVAFPRLNLASFYVYVGGAALTIWALIDGGVDTGWTFYTPYSLNAPSSVIMVATGILILGFSTIATGVNFIVTVHVLRAKGMTWMKLPLFVWAIYGTSIIQVLATPVLGMSLITVAIDRAWHLGLFDPTLGGDPILFQHMFWFYSHPAVYIMILPAMGVISELSCSLAHKNSFSYKAIAISTFGIAFVGFLTWGHHMFVAGISEFDAGSFGLLSMLVAIFSAIKVYTWTATLYRGSISIRTPLVYFFAFLFLFVFGGMTGVAVAAMSLDIHWTDTYFVVAHFHFIMVGGTLTAFLGALHYWFPKVTGRMYNETWGFLASALVFGGFFFTFFPQFLLGNGGMPRRYYTYAPEFQMLHVASTAGASLLALGMLITLGYLAIAAFKGPPAGDNPWAVKGLEWETSSPPPAHNFRERRLVLPPDFEPYAYWKAGA